MIECSAILICDRCGFRGPGFVVEVNVANELLTPVLPVGWQRAGLHLLCPSHRVTIHDQAIEGPAPVLEGFQPGDLAGEKAPPVP
jgi:hypothetical protein